MNIGETREKIEEALDIYRSRLDTIPDDLFTVTPPGGGWSYAEVYSHILQTDLGGMMALEKCARNGKPTSAGRNMLGLMVFLFGSLPPWKTKVPAAIDARIPAKKITKEEARNMLIKCRQRISELTPLLHDSSKYCRVRHARLGMLNARQWFKFILIHSKHHLKQLDRVEKKLQPQ
ncbi:MAG: DinB family protein [Mucilaginibacter sp.]|nr:DinB family protein [Mucilaginibacter sp.]